MRSKISTLFAATLFLPLEVLPQMITATARSTVSVSVRDDRIDPEVGWNTGEAHLFARFHASGIEAVSGTFPHIVGPLEKNTLPSASARAAVGAYRESAAERFFFDLESVGRVLPPNGYEAFAETGFNDPFAMVWTDEELHDLVMEFTIDSGATVEGFGEASRSLTALSWSSALDFDRDGAADQLFWSLMIRQNTIALSLGEDVTLGGSTETADITSTLLGYWNKSAWVLPDTLPLQFQYSGLGGGPGGVAVSLNGHAVAFIGIPEPQAAALCGLISLAVLLIPKRRRS